MDFTRTVNYTKIWVFKIYKKNFLNIIYNKMPRKRRTVVARKKPIRTTSSDVARRKRKTPIHGVVVDQYGNGWLTDKIKAGYNAVKGRLHTYARDTARRAVAGADGYLKKNKPISSL